MGFGKLVWRPAPESPCRSAREHPADKLAQARIITPTQARIITPTPESWNRHGQGTAVQGKPRPTPDANTKPQGCLGPRWLGARLHPRG